MLGVICLGKFPNLVLGHHSFEEFTPMTLTPIKDILAHDQNIEPLIQQLQIPGLHLPDSTHQSSLARVLPRSYQNQELEDTHIQSATSADTQHTQLVIPSLESFF